MAQIQRHFFDTTASGKCLSVISVYTKIINAEQPHKQEQVKRSRRTEEKTRKLKEDKKRELQKGKNISAELKKIDPSAKANSFRDNFD